MKRIDGGRGGGQLLRWAVAMASIEQEPIRIENIRGARDTPGLRAQHVAAVRAAASFTDADVDGLVVGSETITFDPGSVTGGEEAVDVGTAGSIPLIFDTILPLGVVTEDPITLHATGGTDVKWSPPVDFHRYVKLPFLERFGVDADISINRRGFYPKGGGEAQLTVGPSTSTSIGCTERGHLGEVQVISIATKDLSEASVAERQARAATERLEDMVHTEIQASFDYVEALSPGTVVLVVATYDHSIAGFSALGERGKPAEDVAFDAVADFHAFHETDAAIDSHLADQLLPLLSVSGGEITTPEKTPHIETGSELLASFGYEISIEDVGDVCRITSD